MYNFDQVSRYPPNILPDDYDLENLRDARHTPQWRLSLIERARITGNVAKTCRAAGISRTQFYEFKNRYDREGVAGLADRPLGPHTKPLKTSPEVESQVVRVMAEYPEYGSMKIRRMLAGEEIILSRPTILNIAARNGMKTRENRYVALEKLVVRDGHDTGGEMSSFRSRSIHNPDSYHEQPYVSD